MVGTERDGFPHRLFRRSVLSQECVSVPLLRVSFVEIGEILDGAFKLLDRSLVIGFGINKAEPFLVFIVRLVGNTQFMRGNGVVVILAYDDPRPAKKYREASTLRVVDRDRLAIRFIIRYRDVDAVISAGNSRELEIAIVPREGRVYRCAGRLLQIYSDTIHGVLVKIVANRAGNVVGVSGNTRMTLSEDRQGCSGDYEEYARRVTKLHGTSRAGRGFSDSSTPRAG